jgi:hypothetical protein
MHAARPVDHVKPGPRVVPPTSGPPVRPPNDAPAPSGRQSLSEFQAARAAAKPVAALRQTGGFVRVTTHPPAVTVRPEMPPAKRIGPLTANDIPWTWRPGFRKYCDTFLPM